eukprot:GHVO01068844.1.p1 GENE.GHVO01068844.1~~GHVO01068844.1.p1  ORF type:complete len:186 (-),score=30.52 GHVO01068844.1:330-809(-)
MNGIGYVAVNSNIKRSFVRSRFLPYWTCIKYQVSNRPGTPPPEEPPAQAANDPQAELRQRKEAISNRAPSLPPPGRPLSPLYLSCSDSVLRYNLAAEERLDLAAARPIAWTLGVVFHFRTVCCYKYVTAVEGEGVVWIQSTRTARTISQRSGLDVGEGE